VKLVAWCELQPFGYFEAGVQFRQRAEGDENMPPVRFPAAAERMALGDVAGN
jgi:hypothetical protein